MKRSFCAAALVAGLAATSAADRVILHDGRTVVGRVTELGASVRVDTPAGPRLVARTDILRIERTAAPATTLADRLAVFDRTNADAVYQLAIWASEQGLPDDALRLFRECLVLRPDHAGARLAVGEVAVDGRWYPVAQALAIARGWRAAGLSDRVAGLLDALGPAATEPRHRREVLAMRADLDVQAGAWDAARQQWATLLALTRDAADRARLEARLAILDENPDGLWLVLGRDAPEAQRDDADRPSGFYPLDAPWVMDLALRHEARRLVEAGDAALQRAKRADAAPPPERLAVEAALREAAAHFDHADALRSGIAKSHRLELYRHRIGLARREAERDGDAFDREMELLPGKQANRAAYRSALQRMLGQLNRVEDALEQVVALASDYPDELDLEIQWTRLDLERVRGTRGALRTTLDALR